MSINQIREELTTLFESHSITGGNNHADKDAFSVEEMVNLIAMYVDGKLISQHEDKVLKNYREESPQHDNFPSPKWHGRNAYPPRAYHHDADDGCVRYDDDLPQTKGH